MPKFSIVIPCFNAAETLPTTLASIRQQSCDDFEIICVDDGSTDETRSIVSAASDQDPRITIVQNPGKGPSDARNHGSIDLARGEIIAFCDADDLWSNVKLVDLSAAFDAPTTQAAFGQVAFFHDDPNRVAARSKVPSGALTIEMLLGENPVCTMSNLAVRRSLFAISGGFDARIVHNEDLEWLIRIVGLGVQVSGLASCHTWYRMSRSGLSADLHAMLKGRRAAIETAARFGQAPSRKANAVFQRYLARRALRLNHSRTQALGFAIRGLAQSPAGFFSPPRRGILTLVGAVCASVMPASLASHLFSR